jgi:hypothetical protein
VEYTIEAWVFIVGPLDYFDVHATLMLEDVKRFNYKCFDPMFF